MVEAEAAILRLFSKRGCTAGYLKPKLLTLAIASGRLSILTPPGGAAADSQYGCVVRPHATAVPHDLRTLVTYRGYFCSSACMP